MSPTGNFGSVTTRPSTRTPRLFRMCRASRAVSQSFSMSRRIDPIGTLSPIACGPADEGRIRFTWRGAWAARFRWARGCVLVILPASHDHARGRGDPGPPFSGLSGHGPFDVRPFHLALRGHDHAGVVLELDHHAFRTTEGTALPDDDRVHHLLAGLRGPLFHRDDQEVGDPRRRQAIPHAAVLLDLDDLHDLRAGVVDALEAGSLREAPHLPSRKTLHAATP